ncbi:MAG: hypothetical protein QOG53_2922 [Frankiales bacterium]|jgi:hypothetical protein|nr:hypothetical protein [Frankiales bacterium]
MRPGGIPAQLVGAGLIPNGSAGAIASMYLDPVAPAPGVARKFVEAQLSNATVAQREAAVLLTSELVTNVVLNARTSLEVGVGCVAGSVLLAVADRDSSAETDPSGIGRLRGRGKVLVSSLADEHGTLRNARGNTVWLVLHEHGRATGAGALDFEAARST